MDDGRPERVDVEAVSCTECHRAIAEEWAETLHALAWVDPHYRAALAETRRPEGCHGCHIPMPLHASGVPSKPPPRTADVEPLELGVTCNTCHAGPSDAADSEKGPVILGPVILGPWGAATDAHRSLKSPSFEGVGRDALCSACHATSIGPVIGIARDFAEAELAASGKSCVGCHMSVEFRPAAISPEGVASEERLVRSHRINGPWDPEFLAGAFELSARAADGRTTVSVANQAGHRVPGLTLRAFRLEARLLDAEGEIVAQGELVIDSRAHLPVEGTRELVLAGDAEEGSVVEVVFLHLAPGVPEPIRFLETRLDVARSP